ncbi:hypothetical protein K469DRAFT_683883 [Zopfia rhizophila CBS 207.26]|uniref:ABC toxin N-terminal domain-containing protein n=1 Tax=Zopfia rhizophila CBS 207.26 TaxID=1314779 RepID=A0A6A6D8P4_9PEZI|nr:hypothetical protein K469DRAFT_683883 [Zopfia rhizophila CBS 207.26]
MSATTPGSKAEETAAEVNKATLWKVDDISKPIAPKHFDLQEPGEFKNEKISVDIDKLFNWGKPAVSFASLQTIDNDIKTAIWTKYTLSDWGNAIKPTYDILRQNQSNALVAYWSFNRYSCNRESSTQTACSSSAGTRRSRERLWDGRIDQQIDRDRWQWMQRYRLWEASRKVHLFPENWIQSSLQDDKSPQFKVLESEVLQQDISEKSVLNTMKNYPFAVDEVANLTTIAVYVEDLPGSSGKDNYLGNIKTAHFFERPASSPYK